MKTALVLCICVLFFSGVNSQVTQCNAEEYMAVVLNLEALRVQFKELKAAFEELNNTVIANLQAKDIILEAGIDNADAEIASLKANISTLSDTVDSETAALKAKDTYIEANISTLEDLVSADITGLRERDTDLQSSIDGITNTDIAALQAKDTVLEGRLDTAEGGITSLETLTSGHSTSITELQAKDSTLESNVNTNSQSLSTLNSASTALTGRVETLETAMSSPVAFYADSSDVNHNYPQSGNGVPLVLNHVVHQTGSADYDTTTGKYTVPVTGYYVFTFTVLVTKTSEYGLVVRIGYYHGRTDVSAQTSTTVLAGSDAKAVSGTTILLLYQGAQVWVDTHNPDAEVSIHSSWFAGWLQNKT